MILVIADATLPIIATEIWAIEAVGAVAIEEDRLAAVEDIAAVHSVAVPTFEGVDAADTEAGSVPIRDATMKWVPDPIWDREAPNRGTCAAITKRRSTSCNRF